MIVDDGLPSTVRMHPDDLALMKYVLIETLGENAPEFVADVTITPGGCVIHTPSMAVDATVEKRWARAVGNLDERGLGRRRANPGPQRRRQARQQAGRRNRCRGGRRCLKPCRAGNSS